MKLVILPGAGNPDSMLYSKVYGLLAEQAPRFGYCGVETRVRWPGHTTGPRDSGPALSFHGAVAAAEAVLAAHEVARQPYDLLARSFGTYVALKATMVPSLQGLRRVILWGPPPFWRMWEILVRDIATTKEVAVTKGVRIDESLFADLEPVESLLQHTVRTVIIATGTLDAYATPAFHSYLSQLAIGSRSNLVFRSPVNGAGHEVTGDLPPDVVEAYLNAVLA